MSATDEGEKPLKERKLGDVTPPPSEEGELLESEDDKPLKYRRKPKRGSAKSTEQRAVRKRDPNDVWDNSVLFVRGIQTMFGMPATIQLMKSWRSCSPKRRAHGMNILM